MSRSVSVVVTDTLDGSANAETVSFGVGGVTYEIDLDSMNRARLEQVLLRSWRLADGRPAAAAAPVARAVHGPIARLCGLGRRQPA
jgi:hypothetical protein